ncbi:ABC transporter ATP-binding protein [Halorientalis pallida]|uniref:ABC transporter ATP-binding protein n=1 Tax=Halorientalis pallida TaxID=2479928 RepID=A0A498L2W7_9EURY|nr:ABC transporter ATP-binding protein [Halorientalis pallida]RXK49224.1 ABC transporter ATP-binding protein [Halorientalis pallida]
MSEHSTIDPTDASTERPERPTAVTVEGLDYAHGDVSVFADLSVGVDAGTVTSVVGPNGSGKSTLLALVAGVLEPDAGTVTVAGDGDRTVGYLAQRPEFRPQFTVRRTVGFYCSLVAGGQDVDALLDRVGLTPVADRRVGALSGGMVRLLGIAQAAVGDPAVLVLDEPTSGLDPEMTRRVAGVVTDLAESGAAVLVATHDLHLVDRFVDRVLVLDRGTLRSTGSPADLRDATGADTLDGAIAALTRAGGSDGVAVSAGLDGGVSR